MTGCNRIALHLFLIAAFLASYFTDAASNIHRNLLDENLPGTTHSLIVDMAEGNKYELKGLEKIPSRLSLEDHLKRPVADLGGSLEPESRQARRKTYFRGKKNEKDTLRQLSSLFA
jgi:hypothetical protein